MDKYCASSHRMIGLTNGERETVTSVFARAVMASALIAFTCCTRDTTPRTAATSPGAPPIAAPAARTTLLGDLGPYHRDILTTNREAQQFFDEGLTLLYGFNHAEAFASFAHAAMLDPQSPMPHWGMALALGTNINDPAPAERVTKAYGHLAEAMKRATNGSAVEQGLVAALSKRYVAAPSGEQSAREQAYSDAMGSLSKQFPDDADVATLYAESMMNLHPWRLYRADGTPEAWTPAIVATLERVLKTHERHPGANHYYVHAVEASRTPDRASAAATRLETLVPGAGHLVHMPSHIYIRTGQYTQAAKRNAVAAAVDEAYFKQVGTQAFYSMAYYGHNLQFESAAAMFAGNLAEARMAAQRTVTMSDPVADQMAMLEAFASQELLVLARFGEWAAILASRPPVGTRTVQSGLYHWARGVALAHTGKLADAGHELDSLQRTATRVPKDAMVGPINWGGDVLAVAAADLRGHMRQAAGDASGAVAAFRDAVVAEDRLGYNEPVDWLLPERERLGVALLSVGDGVAAESVFRADLVKNVGNPRSLHGLWRSLASQGKTAAATKAKADFDAAWRGADVILGDDLYPKR